MTTRIPLARGKGYALVDDADVALVSAYSWHRVTARNGRYYAEAYISPRPARRRVFMHVLITGQREIDHANRDGLDNTRANLREATRSQNSANAIGRAGTSRFKGVSFHRVTGKWAACLTVNRQYRWLGLHTTEEEAAAAYDAAALEAWGEFARLNLEGRHDAT